MRERHQAEPTSTRASLVRLVSLALTTTCCAGPPMPPRAAPGASLASPNGPIVVLGDTQRTTWAEATWLGREQNETARRALIQKIASEERPAFVVHLGDMVDSGGSSESWEYFDRLMSPLTARHVRLFPVLGNHDHWGGGRALQHARSRFPELGRGGFYARKHGELGLIWLDSNLGGEDGRQQSRWLARVLVDFECDRTVHGVVLFTHHPAYTNGQNRHGERYVQQEILPLFIASPKTVAFLSGHVHGYERFQAYGREFVVTAGGGGPRVEYRMGSAAPYAAAYVAPDGDRRPFNYVVMEPTQSGLHFTVKCLSSQARCTGGVLERFEVAYPALPTSAQSRCS